MAENRYIDLLKNRGFFCFFCTQFLGAFNDNFYKIIVTLVALDLPATASGANPYIPLIGGLFILPFLLFSGYAGYLAIEGAREGDQLTLDRRGAEYVQMLIAELSSDRLLAASR